jgi:hypothetical protein
MKVAFRALVKQVNIKSLVSGDKEVRLILQFSPTDDILNKINKLHKADDDIFVVLMDEEE